MKKVTIEFDLSEPGGLESLDEVLRARAHKATLEAVDNYLRGRLKYHSDELSGNAEVELQKARDFLWSELTDRNLSLWS